MQYIVYKAEDNVTRCHLEEEESVLLLVMIAQGHHTKKGFMVHRFYAPLATNLLTPKSKSRFMSQTITALELRGIITKFEKGRFYLDLSKSPFEITERKRLINSPYTMSFTRDQVRSFLCAWWSFENLDKYVMEQKECSNEVEE